MILFILKSFLAGFFVASIPGAVQATVFHGALNKKAISAIKFALGASTMDAFYMFLIQVGVLQFLIYKNVLSIITLVGSGYILYLGIITLRESIKSEEKDYKVRKYWQGILVVLLHPPTILFFFSVVKSFGIESFSYLSLFFCLIALFLGSAMSFVVVALVGRIIIQFSSLTIMKIFKVSISLILIFFAVKLFFDEISIFLF